MQNVHVVRPDDRLREGPFSAVRHIAKEIAAHREHVVAAFKQDFREIYHGTALGVIWNLILPLVPIAIYSVLSLHRVLPSFDGVNPAVYVALGATVWFLLAGCILQPIQTVRSRNMEVMKTAMPLSAAVVSSFAQLLFDTGVRTFAVVLLVCVTANEIHWSVLLLPVILLPSVMFFFGLGLILGIANVIYADVARISGIVLQYGIFLSGVIFPVKNLPFSEIFEWNPAYILIEAARVVTFRGAPENIYVIGGCSLLGVLVFFIGCRVFYLMEYRVRGIS